jgi:hypothetical protein
LHLVQSGVELDDQLVERDIDDGDVEHRHDRAEDDDATDRENFPVELFRRTGLGQQHTHFAAPPVAGN